MRRKDREVTDPGEIDAILRRCHVCRLAMADEEGLYLVPLSFGYTLEDGQLTLYFHSAREGRKIRAIARSPQVAFEMDGGYRLTGRGDACAYSCRFESVVGTGRAELLTDPREKIAGLQVLMRCLTEQEFSFTEAMVKEVAVIRVTADHYTAKAKRR